MRKFFFWPFTEGGSFTAGFQNFGVTECCRNALFCQQCFTSLSRFVGIALIGPRMVGNVPRYQMICIVYTFYVQTEWKWCGNAAELYKYCKKRPFQGVDLFDKEKKNSVKSIIMNKKSHIYLFLTLIKRAGNKELKSSKYCPWSCHVSPSRDRVTLPDT